MTNALIIARTYHDAWISKDFAGARAMLADNLETDVPLNTYSGAADFLDAVHGFGSQVEAVTLLAEFGADDQALLLYDLDLARLGPLRVAEHFTVADGRITRIRHVHDTAVLRAAGFGSSGQE